MSVIWAVRLQAGLLEKSPLPVFDKDLKRLDVWDQDGVTVAKDLRDLAIGSEVVLTCLPTSNEVKSIVLGENGISRYLAPGSLIVDMTSGDPAVTREISELILKNKIEFIDAPVSGGPRGAQEGTIAIMVGGSHAQFERVNNVLSYISHNIIHAGRIGSGHSIKLGNNLLNLICRMGTLEVISMLVREGVAPDMAVDIIQKSSGRNYATEITLPDNILSGKMNQGFSTAMMEKDSSLALQIGAKHELDMALGKVAQTMLERTIDKYGLNADMSAVASLFESETGAQIRP